MKRQLLFLALMLMPLFALADAVEIDGIYYNLNETDKTAEVTKNPNKYAGEITIPDSITFGEDKYIVSSIGEKAFQNCSELKSIKISGSVLTIGKFAFSSSGLSSVIIPGNVISINDNAFERCSYLTTVEIQNGVKYIQNEVFRNCRNLTTVKIFKGIISIGEKAFYYCQKLSYIDIPESVTTIGGHAFDSCTSLASVNITDLSAWCGICFTDFYSNPLYYAHHLYLNGNEIENLVLPNNITSVKDYSFICCSGLTSVELHNNVETIGGSAFEGCTGLTSIIIPSSVTSIGGGAFSECKSLTSIEIPNSVMTIGAVAFYGCSSLTSIELPKNISVIENSTFYYSGLHTISIPDNVTYIGDNVFTSCNNLMSVYIPHSVTYIGKNVFQGCPRLSTIDINSNNKTYDSRNNCNAVIETSTNTLIAGCKNTIIPNSVTSIGEFAFQGCSSLATINIPNSVSDIGILAFYDCTSLKSISIPNSIKSLYGYIFCGCSNLASVNIANSVESITENVFEDCIGLDSFIVNWMNPITISEYNFRNVDLSKVTLYVPKGTKATYERASIWNTFGNIVEINENNTCSKPTISYRNGKLSFNCDTENVSFQYSITDEDIKSGSANELQLCVTYKISVYATKTGYKDSETVTATLCWIDVEPKTEGITNGVSTVSAKALLIKCDNGIITVEGADDGERINVYSPAGSQEGSAISQNRMATINTHITPGDIAIIKIGSRAVKVVMK